ncbi:TnsA endonuclease N-terminal domain-containing protein [uncultured Shewanella sp.]|uniref:TnsA endonuclease N-terminal domain-containing protein n=1 Tax=uncultured Shewanella sp. TaxID=173975 RepID=UPI002634BEA7|nr:TnsA endonuclease N-terminal domain-containing protein [uncultured Shewanella sp.]
MEFDACFHHEYNETIETFASQPEGFYYRFEGKKLPYTPDAVIYDIHGTVKFHEYKPYNRTFDPVFRAKFIAKKEAAHEMGCELILVTDKQIRIYPILNNLKLLHRYSGIYGVSDMQYELLKLIRKSGSTRLEKVAEQSALTMGETRSFLYSLINKGLLKADLNEDDLASNPLVWGIE